MKKFVLVTSLLSASSGLIAANLTNQIDGVGPDNRIKPYVCLQDKSGQMVYALAPGASVDANKVVANPYYVGASLRFDGCSDSNSYLGYLGVSLSDKGQNSIGSYTPPQGIHIAYQQGAIDSKGILSGKINYTEIAANSQLPQAKAGSNWQFNGINLSGLEFSKSIDPFVIPNVSIEDADSPQSDLADVTSFINQGVNTVRVPVRWAYLQQQGPGKGELSQQYYQNYVKPLLESLTQAKVHTIIDLHSYMRYSEFGKQYAGCGSDGSCPDGTLITDSAAYQDVWAKLYKQIKADRQIDQSYLLFDLVNEPVNVPDDKVFTIQIDVIKMLRNQGFDGYILVEGNSWTGLHSWTTDQWPNSSTTNEGQPLTNATLFTRENFENAGINDLSKIVINVHQYLDSNYSGTSNTCQQDLSTTGANGFNLQAFVDYLRQNRLKAMVTEFGSGTDANACQAPLQQFVEYMKTNSATNKDYGFLGWTIWSTGHGWGGYNLRVTPNSYHMDALKPYL